MTKAKDKLIKLRADNALFIVRFIRAIGVKVESGEMPSEQDVIMLKDAANYIENCLKSHLTESEYRELIHGLVAKLGQAVN